MKKLPIFTFVIFAVTSLAFYSGSKQQTGRNFIIIYSPGKGWDPAKTPDRQPYFAFHSRHLGKMRSDGLVVTGGRFSDKGMIIVKAVDEAAAQQFLATDSSVISGTFNAELFPYSAFYEGCITK